MKAKGSESSRGAERMRLGRISDMPETHMQMFQRLAAVTNMHGRPGRPKGK